MAQFVKQLLPLIVLLFLAGCSPTPDTPVSTTKKARASSPKLKAGTPGPLDFTLVANGPHHVTPGYWVHFNVTSAVVSGTDEGATPSVSGLPVGGTASFPNQVRPGGCCGTTVYGLNQLVNPVRVGTLPTTVPGSYTLTVTYTSKSGVVRSVGFPLVVDLVPAVVPLPVIFPADVPLSGQAMWEANMLTFGKLHCTPDELGTYEGWPYYYDATKVYYHIYDYTGDSKWLGCARMFNAMYSAYVRGANGNIQGWRVFPHGLGMSVARDLVPVDKLAVLALLNNGYANFSNVAPVIDWSLSREISYGLETHLVMEALGNPRHPNFQNVVEILFGHFDQWFLSKNALYTQPFMSGGLGAEALIQYESVTHDPRVLPLLQLAADELHRVSWDVASKSFLYYNQGGTVNSPYDVHCTDYPSDGNGHTCRGPSQDLNLLIVPLYGWVYQHTGIQRYRDWGDEIFNAGVLGAYLQGGKQFSQNYRWSGKYLEWRKAPSFPVIPL